MLFPMKLILILKALYQSLFAKNTSCPFGSDLDGPKVPSPPIEPFCNCADAAQTYKKSGKVDIFATDGSVSAGRMYQTVE